MMHRVFKLTPGMVLVDGPHKHRIARVVHPAACKQFGKHKTHVIVGNSSKGETVLCFDSEAIVEVR